jgi:hypothetical protein
MISFVALRPSPEHPASHSTAQARGIPSPFPLIVAHAVDGRNPCTLDADQGRLSVWIPRSPSMSCYFPAQIDPTPVSHIVVPGLREVERGEWSTCMQRPLWRKKGNTSGAILHSPARSLPWAKPPLNTAPVGRLLYRLKHRRRDGTTHVIFGALELVERLAALVAPPKVSLVRYHGLLAPAAAFRPQITPESKPEAPAVHPGCQKQASTKDAAHGNEKPKCRPRNYPWAELLRRIFSVDVLVCVRCGGRMSILEAINPPDAIRKILVCLGLPSRPPPIAPALQAAADLEIS